VSIGALVAGLLLVPVLSFIGFSAAYDPYTPIGISWPLVVVIPALGGGLLLCLIRTSPIARGLGLGLLIGWSVLSVISGGLFTGLTEFWN